MSDFEFLSSIGPDQEVRLMCFTMWMSFSDKGFILQPARCYLQRDCESSKFRTVMYFWWIVRKGGSNVQNILYIKKQYCGTPNNIIKSHIHLFDQPQIRPKIFSAFRFVIVNSIIWTDPESLKLCLIGSCWTRSIEFNIESSCELQP